MSEYFPSEFAKSIARNNSLYGKKDVMDYYYDDNDECSDKKRRIARNMMKKHDRLVSFQELSINTDYEEAIVAYTGIELTEGQEETLRIIHESTVNYMKGKLADKIISKVTESTNGKEIKDLAEIMIALMGGAEIKEKGTSSAKQWVITTTA